MGKRWFPWHLNIRQKVAAGLIAGIVAITFIGIISYYYLNAIEKKQYLAEIADDLSNIILEIRRYEKNFLLYGSQDDLAENRRYLKLGQEILEKLEPEAKGLTGEPQVKKIKSELFNYFNIMEKYAADHRATSSNSKKELEEQLREHGKQLVNLSHQLVKIERERILAIIKGLKGQLLTSIIIFLFVGLFLSFVVSRKILQPLRVIEKTTLRIASGNFKPLPVLETHDETQRVVEAFNRMVAELEKRQDQLVQAKKLSSLGVLTSGVAHQLNNPLNNISTSCQILLEELESPELEFKRKLLSNIEQEVDRARDIVKGLLEFSRPQDFTLKPVRLKEVVERAMRLISSQVPAGIELVAEVEPDLVLSLDAQRMQEAFLNLFMNSIQAIERFPGQIRVEAKADPKARVAEITVADTGKGIPREDLGRIFDPFFTTKEVGVGTGLGLSIVYGIIEKHQGTISVESQPGEGTRFIIRLPLSGPPAPEEATP